VGPSSAPRHALFLRHHEEDDPGFVGAALERRGFVVEVRTVTDTTTAIALEGVHLLSVLGSKWSVYDHDRVGGWILTELEAIRAADQAGIPVFGICFGSQALCIALGGRVEPAPRPELGWTDVIGDPEDGIPDGPWFEFHSDHCLVPPEAVVLAKNDVCVQAFRIGTHFGVQFHPELDAGQFSRWLAAGADEAVVALGESPAALLAETEAREADASRRVDELVGGFLLRAGI
jgi:GMP synthase-like glutamine amidotransferase